MSMRAADETTEVLLTEYIEGTLAPNRRAEIDAYLSAHPREKEVIDQIVSQRGAIAQLPRETAPIEIHDAIQSRLERAVLLDNLAEISDLTGGRSTRWRARVLTAAAVVLVSTGLFTTVYFVIAPPTRDAVVARVDERGKGVRLEGGENTLIRGTAALNTMEPGSGLELGRDRAAGPLITASPIKPADDDNGGGAMSAKAPLEQGVTESMPSKMGAGEKSSFFAMRSSPPRAEAGSAPVVGGMAGTDANGRELGLGGGVSSTRRVVIYTGDVMGTRGRVEQLLKSGGWSYLATSPTLSVASKKLELSSENEADSAGATTRSSPASPAFMADSMQVPVAGRLDRDKGPHITTMPAEFDAASGMIPMADGKHELEVSPLSDVLLLVKVESDQADALAAALPRLASAGGTIGPSALGGGGMGLDTTSMKDGADKQGKELENVQHAIRRTKPAGTTMVNIVVDIRPRIASSTAPASLPTTRP